MKSGKTSRQWLKVTGSQACGMSLPLQDRNTPMWIFQHADLLNKY